MSEDKLSPDPPPLDIRAADLRIKHMKDPAPTAILRLAVFITVAFFLVETAGGLVSGSLSLLGDAGHMLRDVLALIITLSAAKVAERLPTKDRTFGFRRVEILAALLNGLFLVAVGVLMIVESVRRLEAPPPVHGTVMLAVAAAGLVANLYVAARLHGGHDLNVRSALLHVLTDAVSSLAVIAAALLIRITGNPVFDPVLGIAISLLVIVSAFGVIRESAGILLEFAPRGVNFDDVLREMESVEGVESVHYVHLWTLSSDINVIDAHVYTKVTDLARAEPIKAEIRRRLEKFQVRHATLEFECVECLLPEKVKTISHS